MLLPILKIYTKNLLTSDWLSSNTLKCWQRASCQNFVCLAFERFLFHVYYYWETTWFPLQFLLMEHLKIFEDYKFYSPYGLVKYLVFEKFTRFLTPNFTWNHVSTNMCCYLQVLPCHSWLGARFHIRHISFVCCNTSIIRSIESICFPDFFQKSKCTRANALQDDFQDPNLT